MPVKWVSTKYPGVRFYEHATRRHGVKFDRYYAVRYQHQGRRKEEGLGWGSEGWTEQKAALELAKLKAAATVGEGATRLSEKRAEAEAKRRAKAEADEAEARAGISFAQFWRDTYLPAQGHKTPRTQAREESFFRVWLSPHLGKLALPAIAPIHLEKIKAAMGKAGLAPRSAAYALAVVRQVLNLARRDGYLTGDLPTSKVKPPKADNRRQRFLTREEAVRLLAALTEVSRDLHNIALLSLHTGMRAGEIFSLTWGCVDLAYNLILVKDTKSGRDRHAYMTAAVKAMLQARPQGAADALVFPARGGGLRVQVSKVFRQVVDALGLNEGVSDPRKLMTFHSLRHTYASWLVALGTPIYAVAKLLGHQTSAMTERYSHLAPGHLREEVAALERSLQGAGHDSKVARLKRDM